jgi:thiamine pyrophosphate-dependent acetolactate synthase large subunit-like protein
LLPKKLKNILPAVSVEQKEDIVLLQKLSAFFWDKTREVLSSTEVSRVKVINFGTFTRKHWNIDSELRKKSVQLERAIAADKPRTVERLIEEIEELKKMKSYHESELAIKEQINQKKNEYYQALEKPEPDPRRNQELHL